MRTSSRSVLRGSWHAVRVIWMHLWRTMVAGLLVWIPLIITVWVSWFFINKFVFGIERQILSLVDWLHVKGAETPILWFLVGIPRMYGLGIFLAFSLFFVTGVLTRHFLGRKIIAIGEKVVQLIPFVNRVYRAVQQLRDVFVSRQGTLFQKVCLIEYPREGMIAVAFVTSTEQGVVQSAWGKELLAVFIPTTPNPTSGYLVYLPPDKVTYLDIAIEEAMKLIVSGGTYVPQQPVETPPFVEETQA